MTMDALIPILVAIPLVCGLVAVFLIMAGAEMDDHDDNDDLIDR